MVATQFTVERGAILAFARALGYEPQGDLAPPTFAQVSNHFDPDFGARPRPGQPWRGSGGTPTGTPNAPHVGDGFFAEQHYEYHAPVRVGDVLTARVGPSRSWQKQGRRGGLLTFTETVTDFVNQRGEVAVTSRKVIVRTSQRPIGETDTGRGGCRQ